MPLMTWSNELSVGLPDIDREHHWLLDATNLLHDELSKPQPSPAVVGDTLHGLMDYTVNHFVGEESLFQQVQYPHADAHRALHDRFTAQVMGLINDHEAGKDIGTNTLELLKNWLIQHIMVADKAYVPFILAAESAANRARAGRRPGLKRPRAWADKRGKQRARHQG
ncbi:MAG: bacteriohemerythrin [Hydrogenophaga sp.]|uniref:bacteriohemerythrin n=1 Tax=Hydrogenophaga sp. TaxID=1904254 RepID=UPI00274EA205|nr:bacteriohemerythrin [Hydrogenophaga sp.]MDP2418716.1 bacteriohemerythrin [Hydrogenophaga sp.]MDZ4189974.1 bacteriohemerythrin [Hydrogenophaga sp.]